MTVLKLPTNAIRKVNDVPMTTSLMVAEVFGKRHADVLRAIESVECSQEFHQRNFALVDYIDKKGEARSSYNITKDGMAFLVMGFRGKKAAQFKEAYITAFNSMYEHIQTAEPKLIGKKQFRPTIDDIALGKFILSLGLVNDEGKALNNYKGFKLLKDQGVLLPYPTRPTDKWMEAGYFEMVRRTFKNKATGEATEAEQVYITPEGQKWLASTLVELGYTSTRYSV